MNPDWTSPSSEIYSERLARARALPPEGRGVDVRAWLRGHAALEAATAALPPLPDSGSPLSLPLGGDKALAGLLQFLAESFGGPCDDPKHPKATLRWLAPQLRPLARVWRQGDATQALMQPLLLTALQERRLPRGRQELDSVARLLLVGLATSFPGISQVHLGLASVQVASDTLLAEFSKTLLEAQLRQLQAEVGGRGAAARGEGEAGVGGVGDDDGSEASLCVPSLPQLQVAAHALTMQLASEVNLQIPSPHLPPLMEAAARGLAALLPDTPRAAFFLGKAALINAAEGAASPLRDPLPHLLRGAELARAQGSDLWLAQCGWMAAMIAATDLNPALPPAAAQALFEEAGAAYRRCRRTAPPGWQLALTQTRDMTAASADVLRQQAQRSPGRWQAAIQQERVAEMRRGMQQVLDAGLPACDACRLPSAALRQCAACKQARYCSRECQTKAWPQHKAACKAARKA